MVFSQQKNTDEETYETPLGVDQEETRVLCVTIL